jgi:hypothetical protein
MGDPPRGEIFVLESASATRGKASVNQWAFGSSGDLECDRDGF